MIMRIAVAAALLATLAACAPTDRNVADQRALAEARPVGEPVGCIDLPRISYTRVRDDRTIDFYMRGGAVYRNRLPIECPSLHFEERFGYSTSLSRLCSVDTIRVLRSGGVDGPSCGVGAFQRIETSVK